MCVLVCVHITMPVRDCTWLHEGWSGLLLRFNRERVSLQLEFTGLVNSRICNVFDISSDVSILMKVELYRLKSLGHYSALQLT